LLEVTQQYYYAEGERLVNDRQGTTATAFFCHCHRRLQEEKNRARAYLFVRTKPLLEACVQESLIKSHAPEMLQDTRMEAMFKLCVLGGGGGSSFSSSRQQQVDDEFDGIAPTRAADQQQQSPLDDLRLLYFLLRRRNVLLQEMLRSRFKAFVVQTGEALIKAGGSGGGAPGAADELVPQLVNLNEQCEKMVSKAFANNTEFQISLREGFETVFRLKQNKVAELLAKRMDYLLRDSQKRGGGAASSGEREVEEQLDASLRLFNMHPTKDMFEAFFTRDLAKRLIYNKSASADLERYVISKLRTISGSSVAVKLEGMMKDTLELSKELNDQYADTQCSTALLEAEEGEAVIVHHAGVTAKCEMTIQILTQGYWPTYPKPTAIVIPLGVQSLKEKFTRFYAAKHKNRVLLWQYGLSQATVVGKYTKGKKEFNCSFYQALVLLAFNEESEVTFGGLLEHTKLEETDLVCALLSLSAGQLKVLQRPSGSNKPAMASDEVFRHNPDFAHRLLKIRVPTVQMKEAEQEEQETSDRVFQERVYVVDAVVVRIMKARRTLSHLELMTSVTKQLKFPAQPSDIKKRIEVQIEREYLKRSDKDPSVYEYLA
jgi:cullin-4